MNTLIRFFNPFAHSHPQDALYDVIENETIRGNELSNLTLSGSLFSLSFFRDVTFTDCVFFASRMENCTFVNCKFVNCSFQFSTVEHCTFEKVEFKGCVWDVSPLRKSHFLSCSLDQKTAYFAQKNGLANKLQDMVSNSEVFLPPIPQESQVEEELQKGTVYRPDWKNSFGKVA